MPIRSAARLMVLVALGPAARAAAQAEPQLPRGVVVRVGELPDRALRSAASEAGGARYRFEAIEAARAEPSRPPEEAVEALRARYLEADFLRCLTTLNDPSLSVAPLLADGHRDAAAAVGVFGAACAFGAGDVPLARSLLDRVYATDLPAGPLIAVTNPDFQVVAEAERRRVARRERVHLRVLTRPRGARASLDGVVGRCNTTPCELTVVPGEHVLAIDRLGYARRVVRRTFIADGELRLALDPAPAAVQRAQLSAALASGQQPDRIGFVRACAMAFGARVVVLARRAGAGAAVLIYDRVRDRIVARTSVDRARETGVAVRSVISEWRGVTEPTPLLEEPLFWVAAVGVAVVTGVIVFFLVSPGDPRHDIVFFTR